MKLGYVTEIESLSGALQKTIGYCFENIHFHPGGCTLGT